MQRRGHYGTVPKWSKGTVLKTDRRREPRVGSTPTCSASPSWDSSTKCRRPVKSGSPLARCGQYGALVSAVTHLPSKQVSPVRIRYAPPSASRSADAGTELRNKFPSKVAECCGATRRAQPGIWGRRKAAVRFRPVLPARKGKFRHSCLNVRAIKTKGV